MVGVFGRLERRIEGAVNGVFARAFKGDVQPVEIAARLQRELDAEAKLLSRDRRLVPNEFTVCLSSHDHDRLAPYEHTFTAELIPELRAHATAMGYVFNGPLTIHLEHDEALPTGRFTVASKAVPGTPAPVSRAERAERANPASVAAPAAPSTGAPPRARRLPDPQHRQATEGLYRESAADDDPDATQIRTPGRPPELVLEVNGMQHLLEPPGLVVGRGSEADLRINDPSISRRHAEFRVTGYGDAQSVELVDLGSMNGIVVDGRRVREAQLRDGSRIEIGSTRMLVHAPADY